MSIRESTIERAVCKWAKDHGIRTLKLAGPNARGQADRLFWKGTKVAWCELKSQGKKPTALQAKFIRDRWEDGFPAEYFDNAPQAIEWLRQVYQIPYRHDLETESVPTRDGKAPPRQHRGYVVGGLRQR